MLPNSLKGSTIYSVTSELLFVFDMFRSSTTEFVVLLQAFNRLPPNTQNTMPNEYIYIYIINIYIYIYVQGRALACALDCSLAFALGFSHACAVDFCFGLRHEVIQ